MHRLDRVQSPAAELRLQSFDRRASFAESRTQSLECRVSIAGQRPQSLVCRASFAEPREHQSHRLVCSDSGCRPSTAAPRLQNTVSRALNARFRLRGFGRRVSIARPRLQSLVRRASIAELLWRSLGCGASSADPRWQKLARRTLSEGRQCSTYKRETTNIGKHTIPFLMV